MTYIDGTPIEEFQALGKKMNSRIMELVEKSDFAGFVAHRVDVTYEGEHKDMKAKVYYSSPSDSNLRTISFSFSDPVDLIRRIHGNFIWCAYSVPFSFDDKEMGIHWLYSKDAICCEYVFSVVGRYSGSGYEKVNEAIAMCDVIPYIKALASKRSLDEQETCTLEFDDLVTSRDIRTCGQEPFIDLIWNERNWCYDFGITFSGAQGGAQFNYEDVRDDDISISNEFEGGDPHDDSFRNAFSQAMKLNPLLLDDEAGIIGSVENLYRRFSWFKDNGADLDGPTLNVIDTICRIGHDMRK